MSPSTATPPSDSASVFYGSDEGETHRQIKQMCLKLLPSWRSVSLDGIMVTTISGGISNLIVKVSPPDEDHLAPVAFKIFGEKTELLVDRDQELQTLIRLNVAGFGAQVLGTFANGRIEEFLVAKTLEPQDMADPRYVPHIARKLQQLHALPTTGEPTLWPTIYGWLEMAVRLFFEDAGKQAQFSKIDFAAMKSEIDQTKAACDSVCSPIVFSHNDLLSGNILVVERPGLPNTDEGLGSSMQFIDYEYSACGYRGYDFANHFNEYAGFECDYSRYPSSGAQRLFFTHYLSAAAGSTSATAGSTGEESRSSDGQGAFGGAAVGAVCKEASEGERELQLQRMEAEANLFALASHIYWGVWSLIQARYSPIEFDYLGYSKTRWREYHQRKETVVGEAKRVFGR